MSIRILRQDVFPIQCINPECSQKYNVEDFINVINLCGLIYADCGDTIYQGITCECKKPKLIPIPRNNPIVDLRDFIIIPNLFGINNIYEQVMYRKLVKNDHDSLRFKFIPAWNDESVSYDEILRFYHNWFRGFLHGDFSPIDIPYIMTPKDIQVRLNNEYTTGETQLRRLYPDIPKFRNLLTCLSPNWISKNDKYEGLSEDGSSRNELEEKKVSWLWFFDKAIDKPLKDSIKEYLKSQSIPDFDDTEIDSCISQNLLKLNRKFADKIRFLSRVVGYELTIMNFFKESFNDIYYSICSDLSISHGREGLSSWVDKVKKGEALFVDAPMGLGKSHSIRETLVNDLNLSAVIFMPTNNLCEKMVNDLKISIAHKIKKEYQDISNNTEFVKDENGKQVYENGIFKTRMKREFLEGEVYYSDGINEKECPHFKDIIKKYREKWIIKKDWCGVCNKKEGCRFILHRRKAPLSRIVVTTHHQYDRFYDQESMRKWYKQGYDNEDKAIDRDFFIVDEDFILSKCYQPIQVKYDKLIDSVATVREFLKKFEDMDANILKIDSLFSQISLCKKSAVVKSIAPDFSLPKKIIKDWNESFYKQYSFIPDILDDPGIIGNHLEIIDNGLRLGVVVQKHGTVNKVHFPNSKAYDLSNLPPHIFFDGTMIDKKFLRKKLHNVKFHRMKIDVKVPWELRVWQNVNTDLPKNDKRLKEDKPKVEQFVRELINELGTDHKYFFITKRKIRKKYLESFLERQNFNNEPVLGHYGNIRGINDAMDCDIGVMLGSFMPSDAVEIAMALEFIQDKLPKKGMIPTRNELWSFQEDNYKRLYYPEYAIVGEMAEILRLSEHRQAIARTRYIFHDVDFYVLSKDPVDDDGIEPNAQVKDYQYRSDIFPPRKERSDANVNYENTKKYVSDWLKTNDTVIPMEIHREYGIGRHSASDYLKKMLNEGLLVKKGKTKYMLPLKTENGQDSL